MPNIPAKISFDQKGFINIELPITSPTGKIRVKEKTDTYEFGMPLATRQKDISSTSYIEWQIGYDNENLSNEGVIKEIEFIRKGETKYGFELSNILYTGIRNSVFPANIITELLTFATSISKEYYADIIANIERNYKGPFNLGGLELHRIEEIYPVFYYIGDDYNIELVIKHKQRAVGYQAMIYVCLPLSGAIPNVIGRKAEPKEHVNYRVNQTSNNFVYDAFKVFALASSQHNEDMRNILTAISKLIL